MGQQYCQELAIYFAYVQVWGATGHHWGRKEVGAGNSLWLVKGRLYLPEGNTLLPLFIIYTTVNSKMCFPGLCFSSSSSWPVSLLHPQMSSSSSYLTSIPLSFGWQYSILLELILKNPELAIWLIRICVRNKPSYEESYIPASPVIFFCVCVYVHVG